jgi:signal transduction histidine kinase
VSLFPPDLAAGGDSQDRWGLLLRTDYLKDPLLLNILQHHEASEKSSWLVRGREDQTVLASENLPAGSLIVKTNFSGNVPDWILEFYHPEPRLFEAFLTSRRGIYFYMFLLIAGILIFGLILTVRTVSHELELARMKSDFVSTISHEFKSPLTSIRQLAEMLHSGRVPSEERRQKYYDVLLEQSERLSLLIENVLNFAKIEEGRRKFVFVTTDITSLLEDLVSSAQERVRHVGFDVQLEAADALPLVMADSEALSQALNNVIDNAIKYSGTEKKVEVRAYREDHYLVITVQDFGIGIEKGERGKIFDRFYRGGDELTRTVKGSGLGLTLVKQIVEAHHGSVQVESEPGQGSTFSIKLPLVEKVIKKK